MRKTLTIFGLIFAILALVLATLPLSNIAFIPAVLAFAFGIVTFMVSKKLNTSKNTINLIFLITVIALALATYKAIFNTVEVGNTEELEKKEEQSKEDALEDLEDIDLEIE